MPIYQDKKTSRLYIEFQYKGTRYKERLPEGSTRKDAERIEVKVKNDLMFQSHGVQTRKDVTFDAFIKDVFSVFVLVNYSTGSRENARLACKAALPFFKGKPLRSIKAADIERFKASRMNLPTYLTTDNPKKRAPATVEREMSIISRIFSMAVKNDLCDYNPCSRVEKLKFDNVMDKVLRREDEALFFSNMHSPWAKDICRMVLNTGLRQKDIMNLTRFNVDRTNGLITLVQSKTKRRVLIPLNSDALTIIEGRWHSKSALLFPSPVTGKETGSVRHAMHRACGRAKIEPLTIRDLRRTFVTRIIENGADAVTAARVAGHSSLRMIQRYVRSVDLMRNATDSLVVGKVSKLKVVK